MMEISIPKVGYCKYCHDPISLKELARDGKRLWTFRCSCRCLILYSNGSWKEVLKKDRHKMQLKKNSLRTGNKLWSGLLKDDGTRRPIRQ